MKQRERIGLLPPVRTSDVLVFSSRRKPFRRRDNGVARTPRARTPFFKRMARRLRTARLMERAGLRFVAAPRRLESAYDDDRADAEEGRADAVVEREREEEKEEHDEGPESDGDAEDDDVHRSASSSDSDEIQITGEIAATPPPRGTRAPSLTPAAAVALASRALRLTLKRERGHGNCMFCAFASGLNSWLERGGRATPGWRHYVRPLSEREDAAALHGAVAGSNRGGVEWTHLRRALVRALEDTVADARKRDRDRVMTQLCAGEEGRAWLRRGKFARALPYERFRAHLDVMAKDAAPHSGRDTWTRFWGTDVEVTALCAALGVAAVVIECADNHGGDHGRSPYYLAVPADVAEETAADDGGWDRFVKYDDGGRSATKRIRMRPGRYMPHGEWVGDALEFTPTNRPTGVRLRVVRVREGSKKAVKAWKGCGEGGEWGEWGGAGGKRRYVPAIVVVHAPGHFDSLQPREGTTLVLERSG